MNHPTSDLRISHQGRFFNSPTGPISFERVETAIAPGKDFAVRVFLETDARQKRLDGDTTATYAISAVLYPYQFTADGRSFDAIVKEPNLRIESNTVRFDVMPTTGSRTARRFHDTLNGWWEWIDLTLSDDGRFIFRCFSDAGGERSAVKGSYQESSDTIRLVPAVNGDLPEFVNGDVWTKVRVDRWEALMKPTAVATWNPAEIPNFYPVLYPVDPSTTSGAYFRRPWPPAESEQCGRGRSGIRGCRMRNRRNWRLHAHCR